MAEVDTLCKSLEVPDNVDIHLRFVSELFEGTKDFELDDPTEEFDNYDKRKGKGDKVIYDEQDMKDMEEDKKQN